MVGEFILFLVQMFGREVADSVEKRNPEWRGCLMVTLMTLALIAGTVLLVVVWRTRS